MDDNVIGRINKLADEEHQLIAKAAPGQPLSDDDEGYQQ